MAWNERGDKARLISHVDTKIVTRVELEHIPTPEGTRYHRPVAHIELVNALSEGVEALGLTIAKESFAIGSEGLKLFGALDLTKPLTEGVSHAIGFRHSNDKRMALQVVAGARVFVCDNMSLSGDVTVAKHKHTWGFSLRDMIRRGLDIWMHKSDKFKDSIERMQETELTDTQAQAVLGKALFDGVVTFQSFKLAYDYYFNKATATTELYQDCAPRSAWGLHNAITRALKQATPNAQFSGTIEVGKLFEI